MKRKGTEDNKLQKKKMKVITGDCQSKRLRATHVKVVQEADMEGGYLISGGAVRVAEFPHPTLVAQGQPRLPPPLGSPPPGSTLCTIHIHNKYPVMHIIPMQSVLSSTSTSSRGMLEVADMTDPFV